MQRPLPDTSARYLSGRPGDAWAAEAAARGAVGTQRLLSAGVVSAPPSVRQAFELDDDQVVLRRRLILEDGRPVEIADSYYPAAIAASTPLAEGQKIQGGAVAALAALGHAPHTAAEHVTARTPTQDEQTLLDIGQHEPLLVLTRTVRDASGVPVEYAVNRAVARLSPGHSYRLTMGP